MHPKCFHEGLATDVVVDSEEAFKGLVYGLDTAVIIDEEKAFQHAVEEGLLFGFVLLQGLLLLLFHKTQ